MMVETWPVGFGLFGLGCVGFLFFSPPSDCSSLPSTMTWAPCPHGVRTRGKKTYLSTEGFHSCFTWRHALLQVVRTFEQCTNKEKAKHGEGHMPLTKVGNSSGPSSTEFCRPMPVIYGEMTFQNLRQRPVSFRSGNRG